MIKLSRSRLEFKKTNHLVYKLYGLTPEEIKIVEGNNEKN